MPFADLTYDRCRPEGDKMRPPKNKMRPAKPDPSYVWDRCEKKWRPKKRVAKRVRKPGEEDYVWRDGGYKPRKRKKAVRRDPKPAGDVVWRDGDWRPRKRPYKPRTKKNKK